MKGVLKGMNEIAHSKHSPHSKSAPAKVHHAQTGSKAADKAALMAMLKADGKAAASVGSPTKKEGAHKAQKSVGAADGAREPALDV